MRTRLEIWEKNYRYQIGWEVDGDEGSMLGEDSPPTAEKIAAARERLATASPQERDDARSELESLVVDAAIKDLADDHRPSYGYYFDSRAKAQRALVVARAALKNFEAPMPEWAKHALGAGWKPPKGWKP